MKTVSQIKEEINYIVSQFPDMKPKNKELLKEWNKAQKRIRWLRSCILYLEHLPSEKFLLDQKLKKQKELDSIDKGFKEWQINTPGMLNFRNAKSQYNSLIGRNKVYNHVNTLEYLLS